MLYVVPSLVSVNVVVNLVVGASIPVIVVPSYENVVAGYAMTMVAGTESITYRIISVTVTGLQFSRETP